MFLYGMYASALCLLTVKKPDDMKLWLHEWIRQSLAMFLAILIPYFQKQISFYSPMFVQLRNTKNESQFLVKHMQQPTETHKMNGFIRVPSPRARRPLYAILAQPLGSTDIASAREHITRIRVPKDAHAKQQSYCPLTTSV